MSARLLWRTRVLQGAIVLAPLAYGTVHPLPILLFQLGGFLLFAAWALDVARRQRNWGHLRDPLLLIGYAGIGLGLFQLTPLPPFLLAVISPGTFQWTQTSLTQVGIAPSAYSPIAVVPYAAGKGLVWFAALVAWFGVIQYECRARERARTLILTLAATAIGLALLGLAQSLSGAAAIYWIGLARPEFFATFVNPNNAAGVLTLGAMACLAIGATSPPEHRALWYGGAVVAGGAVFMSLSRGGIGVLVFAILLLAWLRGVYRYRQGSAGPRWRAWALRLGPLGFLAALTLFVLWVGYSEVLGELRTVTQDTDLNGRIPIWRDALGGMWPAFPVFGIGFGNFEHVFPAYHTQVARVTYTSVENEYLHVLLEGGLVGAGLLGVALTLAWRRARSAVKAARPDGMTLPLAAGVAGAAMHLLVDFPFHLGAPALWFMTMLAVVINRPIGMAQPPPAAASPRRRKIRKTQGAGDAGAEHAGLNP